MSGTFSRLKDLHFEIVWTSKAPIRPEPYPASRAKSEWDQFLLGLYKGWGDRWANPGG